MSSNKKANPFTITSLLRHAGHRLLQQTRQSAPRWHADDRPYRIVPFNHAEKGEAVRARSFWASQPLSDYYASYAPQTLLLTYLLARLGATSAFELGCNVGRNLHWLRHSLGIRVHGIDVNPAAIDEGRRYFGFGEEIRVGGLETMGSLPEKCFDVAFTISVLDHLPHIDEALQQMLRVTRKRVVMIELTLPGFGAVDDPRCVGFSYSHDYDAALARMPCELVAKTRTPLGDKIAEHYTTYEVVPR